MEPLDLLSNPFAAKSPPAAWSLAAAEVFESDDEARIDEFIRARPDVPALLRHADMEMQSRVLCSGRKPDRRLRLFGSIHVYKKAQAKRLLSEPAAAGLEGLTVMSPGALDALLAEQPWPFRLASLATDFAPKQAQLEAMASHSGLAELEFLGLYNTLGDRFVCVAALPWLARLRSLSLAFSLDKCKAEHIEPLAAVAFERLSGLISSAKDWQVPDRVIQPIVDAPWLPKLEHLDLELPIKSTKMTHRFATKIDFTRLRTWHVRGNWSEDDLTQAFSSLSRCTDLRIKIQSPDGLIPVGEAPARALVESGCVPTLDSTFRAGTFTPAAEDILIEAGLPWRFGRS